MFQSMQHQPYTACGQRPPMVIHETSTIYHIVALSSHISKFFREQNKLNQTENTIEFNSIRILRENNVIFSIRMLTILLEVGRVPKS